MRFGYLTKCRRCGLHRTRRNVVVGRGFIPADVLFIGEAPGKSEDMRGEPFIGPSGRLLDKMFDEARDLLELPAPSYYITNTALCRPTDSKNGPNRQPSEEEVLKCFRNVDKIIRKVSPKAVVLVGKVAERYYSKLPYKIFTIQHPAFILRTGGVRSEYYITNRQKLMEVFRWVNDARGE